MSCISPLSKFSSYISSLYCKSILVEISSFFSLFNSSFVSLWKILTNSFIFLSFLLLFFSSSFLSIIFSSSFLQILLKLANKSSTSFLLIISPSLLDSSVIFFIRLIKLLIAFLSLLLFGLSFLKFVIIPPIISSQIELYFFSFELSLIPK